MARGPKANGEELGSAFTPSGQQKIYVRQGDRTFGFAKTLALRADPAMG